MKKYTLDELARMIDHTNLKPDAHENDIIKLCEEARKYHFKMVAINQVQSSLCAKQLAHTDINVGAAISFPLGQTTIESKKSETSDAIQNGATEIDYVINLTAVKVGDYTYIEQEMKEIVAICRQHNVISKVIFENCYLTSDEIAKLSEIAKKIKPDFIKTSTGFGTGGATFEDVKLMKEIVGDEVKVKAAGGVRDTETFIKMIQLGAERIGTSSGITIITELKELLEKENKTTIDI